MTINFRNTLLVIDIGGTSVKFGLVISGVATDYSRRFSSDLLRDGDPVEALASMIAEVRRDLPRAPEFIVSTVPGFIDVDQDTILFAGNLLKLRGRRLASELAKSTGLPVLLERDAVLSLLGECEAGAAKGCDSVLGIFFGTGVGAAYIDQGVPFRGGGWALEIGHMPFRREGREFPGMRKDCLETYVSGRALRILADRHGVQIDDAFIATGNAALSADIDEFIKDQAFAIGAAIALFSPKTLLLGGGVCEMSGFPRDRLHQLIAENATEHETGRALDLRWAELGWKGALIGAIDKVTHSELPDPSMATVS